MAINISDFGLPKFKGITNIDGLIEDGVNPLVEWVFVFAIVVAVVFIIISGYSWITSMGDPEKIQKGQRGLTASIIGLVIVFIARIIIDFVLSIIGGN